MKQAILTIFTRTPLHVGAGSSVGAIDQPIIRERHTRFPVIPGSSIKGVLADAWCDELIRNDKGQLVRPDDDSTKEVSWLFGAEDANAAKAGALLVGEARLLAFPVRSARAGFAWVTSPLAVNRAIRDGLMPGLDELADDEMGEEGARFSKETLGIQNEIVLEDQPLTHKGDLPAGLADAFKAVPGFANNTPRLVLVSDGTLGYFVTTACEIATHVKINDETGTAAGKFLFNQENVPADTFFYATIQCVSRQGRADDDALKALERKLNANPVWQFGADGSTGLGYCTVTLKEESSHA